ncbi:MAG: HupE/UreJ family protein, partial [Pseudolabrys sp.]
MTRLFLVLWVLSALLMCSARSDELRPGYLEIRQTTSNTYGLLFKIPASGDDLRLAIYVVLPEGTHDAAPARAEFNNGAYVERRTIRRDGGLAGLTVAIKGLTATSTDVLVRIETLDGTVQTERLTPTRT